MKASTTSPQPRSSEGDQAGHALDFIDSIGQKLTSMRWQPTLLKIISSFRHFAKFV
jgi:hypothetical protein